MNLFHNLPYVLNLLAKVCLGLSIFNWLGDQVSSVRVHPWEHCRIDLISAILSAVATGASSRRVAILGLIGFGAFGFLLIQEYLVLVRLYSGLEITPL